MSDNNTKDKRRERDSETVIEIENLTKKYGDFTALDSLSLKVNRGDILGFIGPNGAGKTTTIRILVGLLKPTSGRAQIAGADCLRQSSKIKRLVGYMPDQFGRYNNMRVSEYLDFFGAAYGLSRRHRIKQIEKVLALAGASHMHDLFVDALSHGMQQRIGIARTLIHDPQVLILDEPANGLDPQARIEMRSMLLRLSELGKTLIVTSHILPELARICDTVAMITRCKLRAYGTVDEIMRDIHQLRTLDVLLCDNDPIDRVAKAVSAWLHENESPEQAKSVKVTSLLAERTVRFTTSLTDQAIAPLLRNLVQQGEPIAQFREVTNNLEDAFLSVAGAGEEADSK
jgi:ABC-2 type transport system ATP-binding protein